MAIVVRVEMEIDTLSEETARAVAGKIRSLALASSDLIGRCYAMGVAKSEDTNPEELPDTIRHLDGVDGDDDVFVVVHQGLIRVVPRGILGWDYLRVQKGDLSVLDLARHAPLALISHVGFVNLNTNTLIEHWAREKDTAASDRILVGPNSEAVLETHHTDGTARGARTVAHHLNQRGESYAWAVHFAQRVDIKPIIPDWAKPKRPYVRKTAATSKTTATPKTETKPVSAKVATPAKAPEPSVTP